jgi:hypothetical protein
MARMMSLHECNRIQALKVLKLPLGMIAPKSILGCFDQGKKVNILAKNQHSPIPKNFR